MRNMIKDFIASEDGAVTVDWVVLSAAVVGLGFAVIGAVMGGNATLADSMSTEIGGIEVDAGN
ncbi:hypothetical protein [Actibacterium lipolyticum]|uniref:Pilus assembly protein n=1 Tax=Actibacterium lipolyticum TaxID=1524263 RepID=A0A238KN00_9RHOB|nr:hypothetical protein [Actibacterium lipolyticum]SMX43987.1 hypothetical protein COL8621_02431 [Actibacterium lipolyticum]